MSVANLTGTIWRFNETITPDLIHMRSDADIDFTSNGLSFVGTFGMAAGYYYFDDIGDETLVYNSSTNTWTNQEYRTIEISGGSYATNQSFIIWLEANATQILPIIGNPLAVGISSGGGSSYTLLYSADIYAKTTNTTGETAQTIDLGSSAYTSAKFLYIKVRAKNLTNASGHFVGSEAFLVNPYHANGATTTFSYSAFATRIIYLNSSLKYAFSNTVYGVYPYSLTSAGSMKIYMKYSATYAADIDGIYNVEVYALDYAPNQGNPFDYSFPANTFHVVSSGNVATAYSFDSGMTWTQWVASAYNTDGFSISNSKVVKGQSGVYTEAAHTSQVAASATITAGNIYFLN